MKKAIIFDLDGTLWDSTRQILPAWNQALAEKQVEKRLTYEEICACMGKTTEEIAVLLFPALPKEESVPLVVSCCERELDVLLESGGSLYPGLAETLAALREKYHLYIVSNCLDGYIQSFLTYHRFWDCFEDLECLGRTGKTKGENIRLIMERNAVDAAIYVGDTASDCAAAKKAGIPFVHAAYGFGKVEAVPAILSIRELPAAADRLLGQQAKKC